MNLLYVDRFDPQNSNQFWNEAFSQVFDEVYIAQTGKSKNIMPLLDRHKVDVIHFGGSVKHESMLAFQNYPEIKSKHPHIKMTAFYGDPEYIPYCYYRAKLIDKTFVTSLAHVKDDSVEYMMCPIGESWLKLSKRDLKYDVVFCGNNYNQQRQDFLKKLDKIVNLTIVGKGWTGFKNCLGPLPILETNNIYRQSKVILNDVVQTYCQFTTIHNNCYLNNHKQHTKPRCNNKKCGDYSPHLGYVSNRLPNAFSTGRPVVSPYQVGLDLFLKNNESIVYYKNFDECIEIITKLLKNPDLCNEIGEKGKLFSEKYTFEKTAKKIYDLGVIY